MTETATSTNIFEIPFDPSIPKQEYYNDQLQGITPDAFFVLGGGNRKITPKPKEDGTLPTKRTRTLTTSPYKGAFWEGVPDKLDSEGNVIEKGRKPTSGGAKARPIAAAELAKFYPDAKIVTFSHKPAKLFLISESQTQEPATVPYSTVLASDLRRLGVDNEIIEKPQTTSSLTEIMEAVMLTAQNDWQNTALVTNDYHVERCQKVLDILMDDERRKILKNQLQFLFAVGEETDKFNKKWEELEDAVGKFKRNDSAIVFVSSENILMRRSKHHEAIVRYLREQDAYRNVVEQEKIGNIKIDQDQYNFAQDSFREYILSPGIA